MNQIIHNEEKFFTIFENDKTADQIYRRLISLGQDIASLPDEFKIEKNRVHGCQSQLYLIHRGDKNSVYYEIDSDAMVSKGLAQVIASIYSGAPAEDIVKHSLKIFKQIPLLLQLSASRLSGVSDLEKTIKQRALKLLIDS